MVSSVRFLFAAVLFAAPCLMAPGLSASELPEEVERQIDKQTEGLPEEIREKIKEAAARKLAELKEAKEAAKAEEDAEDDEEDGEQDDNKAEAKKDDKDKEGDDKKEKKPSKPSTSDEIKKLKAEIDLYEARFKHKVHEYKKGLEAQLLMLEKSKLDRKIEADRTAAAKEVEKRMRDRLKADMDIAKLRASIEKQKLDAELAKLLAEKKRIETEMSVESVKEKLEDRVLGEESYPDEPFKDGVLSISPRRIELNGPIMTGAADYICQRLDYFNNQSDKPIFIVIDNSPGGSVIEGFHILQGMEESKAPIHVVVKRFAASMAACITTLADHSYCYPNAIILHHQASTMLIGNGRVMEDQRKQFDEISRRLLGRVAKKVGVTQEEFVEQMYENRVSGDWDVFGDEAVERGWVDHIATGVLEESIRKRPKGTPAPAFRIFGQGRAAGDPPAAAAPSNYLERYEPTLAEQLDEKGRPFVRLPRISPIDAWLIYNPDGYYRY